MPKTLAAKQILPHDFTEDGRIRAVIDAVLPAGDGGRFAVKRVAGESVRFTAHCFTDGHEVLRVMLRRRAEDQPAVREVPMRPLERFSWFALCVSVPARRSVPSNDEPCLGRQ